MLPVQSPAQANALEQDASLAVPPASWPPAMSPGLVQLPDAQR